MILTIPIGFKSRLVLRNKCVNTNSLLRICLDVHCQISRGSFWFTQNIKYLINIYCKYTLHTSLCSRTWTFLRSKWIYLDCNQVGAVWLFFMFDIDEMVAFYVYNVRVYSCFASVLMIWCLHPARGRPRNSHYLWAKNGNIWSFEFQLLRS